MSLSGVSIYAPDGRESISETDRIGRILPALGRNGYLKREFHHPELADMGEIFVWTDLTYGF
ncbi:hypothetical protein AFK69_13735 [Xenorhabdus sp. GDc328]|nr:hypothetical protein AAY47_01725 [Xenorhabdus griffiniae]KOP32765.1 hypothetical protein AFK69_13735 [Xenorhabdus sp. GDc328]